MAKGKLAIEISKDAKSNFANELTRTQAKVTELEGKLKMVGQAGRRAGRQNKRAFGPQAVAGLARYAGGFLSIGTAIATAGKALRDFRETQKSAAAGVTGSAADIKRLVQISGGDPKRFAAYMGALPELAKQGVKPAEAIQMMFAGQSLGFTRQQVVSAGRYKAFAQDLKPLLEAPAGLRAAFGADTFGGKMDAAVNALLAGAEKSRVNVEQLAAQVLTPAQAVKKLGGGAVETIAAVSTAAPALASVEEAATAVGRASDILARQKKLKGGGLLAGIEYAAGLSEKDLTKLIGENIRAERGIRVLIENLPKFRETIDAIGVAVRETGTEDSRIKQAVAIARQAGPLRELRQAERAEATRRVEEMGALAAPELQRKAIEDATMAVYAKRGVGPFSRMATQAEFEVRAFLGDELNDTLRWAMRTAAYWSNRPGPRGRLEAQNELLDLLLEGGETLDQPAAIDVRERLEQRRGMSQASWGDKDAAAVLREAAKDIKDAAATLKGGPTMVPATVDE
jgi:hypothetical protein